jgi:hypothetical protein
MRIFVCVYSLKDLRIFALNEDFEAKIRQYEKMYLFCIKSNMLYANLCAYFKTNMKRMMQINGVYEYTETCEYEANKIHIRLD